MSRQVWGALCGLLAIASVSTACLSSGPSGPSTASIALNVVEGTGEQFPQPTCGSLLESYRMTISVPVGTSGAHGPYSWTDSVQGVAQPTGPGGTWICNYDDTSHLATQLATGTWTISAAANGWGTNCSKILGAGVDGATFFYGTAGCQ
jgi:hypothetical protein